MDVIIPAGIGTGRWRGSGGRGPSGHEPIFKKKKKKLEPGKTLVMITERDSWSWVILYENISPLLIPRLAIVLGE